MEKDHFKDRTDNVTKRNNLTPGTKVFLCRKDMQKYAKELKDLDFVEITSNLTSKSEHPRGQKVKGTKIETDQFGNFLFADDAEEVVGRCTYIVDEDYSIETSEGKKYLALNSNKEFILLSSSEINGKLQLYCNLNLENEIYISFPVCRFLFLDSVEEVKSIIQQIKIENVKLHMGFISAIINGTKVIIKDAVVDGYDIKDQRILDSISSKFKPHNNTAYKFNAWYNLNIDDFSVEEIYFS